MRFTAGAALLLLSCTPRGPQSLSPAQLQARASRTLEAAFDDAYDATWLTLEGAGWRVTGHDRHAGTLETNAVTMPNGTSRGWTASVSTEGARLAISLVPRVFEGSREVTEQRHWTLEGPGGEQATWDELFQRVLWLVETWRVHPELVLSSGRGELEAAGLRVLVPGWRHFEFSVDRRTLVIHGEGSEPRPTLLYRIERRSPAPDRDGLVHETLQRALKGRQVVAGEWSRQTDAWGVTAQGEVREGQDLGRVVVWWRRWEARSPAWTVRLVAVCPDQGPQATPKDLSCDADIRRVVESAVNTGAAAPGFKPNVE